MGEDTSEKMKVLQRAAGLDDEEVRWRMECARPGANACRVAARHLEKAETAYDKWLYESSVMGKLKSEFERGPFDWEAKSLSKLVAKLAVAVEAGKEGGEDVVALTSKIEARLPKVLSAARELHAFLARHGRLLAPDQAKALGLRAAQEALTAAPRELQKAKGLEIQPALEAITMSCSEATKKVEVALAEGGPKADMVAGRIEIWRERWKNTPEYASEQQKEEEEWAAAELERNTAALESMRSYITTDIASRSLMDVYNLAQEEGSYFTADLCSRLKEKKLLHWLVMHPDDIASENFLQGESAGSFTALGAYDATELRAVYAVLPREFLLDADGRKAAWRAAFVQHLRGLCRQQTGQTVRAGWDPEKRCRAEVRLAPLRPDQIQDCAYVFPSKEEMDERINKLEDQYAKLEQKKARLEALASEVEESKREVSAVCEDARNPQMKKEYGADTLKQLRDQAKGQLEALLREQRSLTATVRSSEQSLAGAFPSLAHLKREAGDITRLLAAALAAAGAAGAPCENAGAGESSADASLGGDTAVVPGRDAAEEVGGPAQTEEEGAAGQGPEGDSRDPPECTPEKENLEARTADTGSASCLEGRLLLTSLHISQHAGKYMIPGPFPSNPVLSKKEAAVVKKLSAEEEAAQREQEMLRLTGENNNKQKENNFEDGTENNLGAHITAEQLRNEPQAHSGFSSARERFLQQAHRSHADEDQPSIPVRKIGKVKIAPDVLNVLTKSHLERAKETNPEPKVTVRRSRRLASQAQESGLNKIHTAPKSPQKPKSKALINLLKKTQEVNQPAGNSTTASQLPPRPALNFLSELRQKKGAGGSCDETALPPRPALNFLSELQQKRGHSSSSGEGKTGTAPPVRPALNFLSELRLKAGGGSNQNDEVSSDHRPANPFASRPAPNFLSELRQKAGMNDVGESQGTNKAGQSGRMKKEDGSATPLSFLDELRQKKSKSKEESCSGGSGSNINKRSTTAHYKKDGDHKPPSFLDELKSKAKKLN